ncbi:MAG: transcriptional regulator [Polyangiaceae bacterium]|nr:transcriptional regulator [Polyangiaceae bacterium]
MTTTTATFLDHLPPELRGAFERLGDLDRRLGALLARARTAWPEVVLDEAALLSHVAARVPSGASPGEALDHLRIEDLALACAVLGGDAEAARRLRTACLPKITAALAATGQAAAAEEVAQQVLSELVLPGKGGQPLLAGYRGTGDLVAWVKVIALRTARHGKKRGERERPAGDDPVFERLTGDLDPELDHFKAIYREAFKTAFEEAFATLDERERGVLRYEVAGGLNIDRIGAIYGVHRATVARWRTAARDKLLAQTRRSMRRGLGISDTELDSVMRLIESRLDVSLSRLLRDEPGG